MSQEGNPTNQNVQSDQATLSNQAGQEHDTASAMPKANQQPTDAADRELGQNAMNKQRASTRLDLFDNSDFHPGNVVKRLLWICFSGLFFQSLDSMAVEIEIHPPPWLRRTNRQGLGPQTSGDHQISLEVAHRRSCLDWGERLD